MPSATKVYSASRRVSSPDSARQALTSSAASELSKPSSRPSNSSRSMPDCSTASSSRASSALSPPQSSLSSGTKRSRTALRVPASGLVLLASSHQRTRRCGACSHARSWRLRNANSGLTTPLSLCSCIACTFGSATPRTIFKRTVSTWSSRWCAVAM